VLFLERGRTAHAWTSGVGGWREEESGGVWTASDRIGLEVPGGGLPPPPPQGQGQGQTAGWAARLGGLFVQFVHSFRRVLGRIVGFVLWDFPVAGRASFVFCARAEGGSALFSWLAGWLAGWLAEPCAAGWVWYPALLSCLRAVG
jgi:hypothetical protein